ncbi:MAG: Npt1/Npt2 family nucleotide transporter [Gemmatimonadota bacterium]
MATLFFLVQCAVGVLRPVKNSIALEGLGAADFYKVYLVSAVVILFVPLYNWLADRIAWRRLIVGIAAFFAASFLFFYSLYSAESTAYGLAFYGWYDLFSAMLVTQFFMATQFHVDARSAKRTYPMVIMGGSAGATAGGALTGFLAEPLGTANLLPIAAALVLLFGLGLAALGGAPATDPTTERREALNQAGLREVMAEPHVRLIAVMVLVTMLVKQLIDYQFNTQTKLAYGSLDAVAAFQGKFNLVTQWLPFLVLLALRPALRRFGVAVAVLLLPLAMFAANIGLLLFWGLWAAVVAKGAENTLRYSAERAGRELLYVPVPDELKLKAKTWIDVAVEKGLGKAAAALLIGGLLLRVDAMGLTVAALVLSILWFLLALRVRGEYVRSLGRSIRGRFASMRGVAAALGDPATVGLLRQALASEDRLQVAFALELLDSAGPREALPLAPELRALLAHESSEIRIAVLELLERLPELGDPIAVRGSLLDPEPAVREAAVRATFAARRKEGAVVVDELLQSEARPVRTATLACLARGRIATDDLDVVRRTYARSGWSERGGDADERLELVLAAASLVDDGEARAYVQAHLDDPDPDVASTALLSAGRFRTGEGDRRLVAALRDPDTRDAARQALVLRGPAVVDLLARALLDPETHPVVRRTIPAVLARIPGPSTVAALVRCVIAPETDQLLDYRTIKAMSKLRAAHPALAFDRSLVLDVVEHEVDAARHYGAAAAALDRADVEPALARLARGALEDAWKQRREGAFRCLGLLHQPGDVHRCFVALSAVRDTDRANALEWIERTVGHSLFLRLSPILGADAADGAPRVPLPDAMAELLDDGDAWVAACATRIRLALDSRNAEPRTGPTAMELIEKVFLLQRVDLLKDARSAHLALLASIAGEVGAEKGAVLIREGEPTEALYVVTRGEVELRGVGGRIVAGEGQAFGTWALIDEAPSLVEARATEASRLLRVRREDFHDLVGDHPELAIGLLQGLARRIRTLVA